MGDQRVLAAEDARRRRAFRRQVLEDLRTLELLLERGLVEDGPVRIGAEQELFLVDEQLSPVPLALRLLEDLDDPRFCTEVGLYNLEANLTPRRFEGDCLGAMARELAELLGRVRAAAAARGAAPVLCGILPSVGRSHLGVGLMTPSPRFTALSREAMAAHGGRVRVRLHGIDTFEMHLDSIMFDACTASFQVHLQVAPADFAHTYNCAQLAAAPQLAAAANSPLLLGRRLWHESRIALIESGSDMRTATQRQRGSPSRVGLGDRWLDTSVVDLFRRDVAMHQQLVTGTWAESSLAQLERGEAPQLAALRLFNGTVWRWNRPCYGISDGRPHLRIENRVLGSGPTVADEVANAAFWLGLMTAMPRAYPDLREHLSFGDAVSNFHAAARYGLDAPLHWLDGERVTARRLLLDRLLPLAREGLRLAHVDDADASHFLDLFEERVAVGQTGAQWMLDSFDGLRRRHSPERASRILTAALRERSFGDEPGHLWPLAGESEERTTPVALDNVEAVLTTDIVTVRPEEPLELVEQIFAWRDLDYVPVEDRDGQLVGLVSRAALSSRPPGARERGDLSVAEVMDRRLPTVPIDTTLDDALEAFAAAGAGCLLVMRDGLLAGLVTRASLAEAARLLRRRMEQARQEEAAHAPLGEASP